jgi:hypothetical protein
VKILIVFWEDLISIYYYLGYYFLSLKSLNYFLYKFRNNIDVLFYWIFFKLADVISFRFSPI